MFIRLYKLSFKKIPWLSWAPRILDNVLHWNFPTFIVKLRLMMFGNNNKMDIEIFLLTFWVIHGITKGLLDQCFTPGDTQIPCGAGPSTYMHSSTESSSLLKFDQILVYICNKSLILLTLQRCCVKFFISEAGKIVPWAEHMICMQETQVRSPTSHVSLSQKWLLSQE